MRHVRPLAIAALALLPSLAAAQVESKASAEDANRAPAESATPPAAEATAQAPAPRVGIKVSKRDWIKGMKAALPPSFCVEGSYFRSCFKVTEEECSKVAAELTVSCLAKSEKDLPDFLVQPEDGFKWGSIVGSCAGGGYEEKLAEKRIPGGKCDDPSAWMPK